ncbi:MAG: lipopolysaccharide heptosyltransferase II [Nitrospira sp.]|nr:lipopolysaccharide heptosyltransferase II [Nitrospira sp.]
MRTDQIKRLMVRAPNWIGDAVMCEPALRGLRSLFPQAELTLLAKPPVAELFVGHASVTHVVLYDDQRLHAGVTGKWALAETLRRHRFDLAVLFQNAFEAAFLAWLAGIPRRYGYATDGRSLLLTDPVAVPGDRLLVHQVAYYWNLLKPLGLNGEPLAPTLTVSLAEEQMIRERLMSAGVRPSDCVIGLNPGSTYGTAKRWLPDRFAEVARRLARWLGEDQKKETAVVIIGAKGEEMLGRQIAEQINARTVVWSGTTTIRDVMAVIKRCRLLLTNDTGPMHIAAAFGVPVVAIFGPTDWRTTAPYGQESGIVRESVECAPCLLRECPIDHRCMTNVSVDRVYETAIAQLARWNGARSLVAAHPDSEGGNAPSLLEGVTVFLDRDGTLNPDPGYIRSPDQYELFPGVAEGLARLKRAGARLIVVTNQSGVARGFLSERDLEAIHEKLARLLGEAGVILDGMYVCPHHPDDGCECRKPNTGLIDRAVRDHAIDMSRSYLIGDQGRDLELAKRVGARAVLVTTGVLGPMQVNDLRDAGLVPDLVASSLGEAVEWILADVQARFASGTRAWEDKDPDPPALYSRSEPRGCGDNDDRRHEKTADALQRHQGA